MIVIVGLGTPGSKYARTRHNLGARAIEQMASRWGLALDRSRQVRLGIGDYQGRPVALAQPRTYMNVSGEAVHYLVQRLGIPPSQILVVYDEMDLPLGTIRLRAAGGPGGHNGVGSIIEALGTTEFSRLRIGVGRPPPFVDPIPYLLGDLTPGEEEALTGIWPRVVAAAESVVVDGLERAMNHHNTSPPRDDGGAERDEKGST